MEQFGWCFIGAGAIANKVADDTQGICIKSVYTRNIQNAQRFADKYGAAAYDSFDAAVTAPGVSGVYVAAPNSEHYESVCRALVLGKPVLCEKPLGLNAAQVREMTALAKENDLFLAEAMWTRYNPVIRTVCNWVKSGMIGDVSHIEAGFAAATDFDPANRRFDPKLGGGAILDVGIYPIAFVQMIYGDSPVSADVCAKLAPTGVDSRVTALLDYGEGRTAGIFAAVDTQGSSTAVISGTSGTVIVPEYWKARSALLTKRNGETMEVKRDGCIGWGYQMSETERLISSGALESPVIPLSDTLQMSELMDCLLKKAGVSFDFN